jgi:hypothetical protein
MAFDYQVADLREHPLPAHDGITDRRTHRPKADIGAGSSTDVSADRVAPVADGRECRVTGNSACRLLVHVHQRQDCESSRSAKIASKIFKLIDLGQKS